MYPFKRSNVVDESCCSYIALSVDNFEIKVGDKSEIVLSPEKSIGKRQGVGC